MKHGFIIEHVRCYGLTKYDDNYDPEIVVTIRPHRESARFFSDDGRRELEALADKLYGASRNRHVVSIKVDDA